MEYVEPAKPRERISFSERAEAKRAIELHRTKRLEELLEQQAILKSGPTWIAPEEREQIGREREQHIARGSRRGKYKVRGIKARGAKRTPLRHFLKEECVAEVSPECRFCIAGREPRRILVGGMWMDVGDFPDWKESGIVPEDAVFAGWSVMDPRRNEALIRGGRGTGRAARFSKPEIAWSHAVRWSSECQDLKERVKTLVSPRPYKPRKRPPSMKEIMGGERPKPPAALALKPRKAAKKRKARLEQRRVSRRATPGSAPSTPLAGLGLVHWRRI